MNKRKNEEIAADILEVLQTYQIDYLEFFHEYDANDNPIKIPILIDGELNIYVIESIAAMIGVTPQSLISMSDDSMKWLKKYPYFIHKPAFDAARRKSFHDNRYDTLHLLEVIYDKILVPEQPTRYNPYEVAQRLESFLRKTDEAFPGTYHKGAKIKDIYMRTDYFSHFDSIDILVSSYLGIINRIQELFFKAWDVELDDEEVKEYNFLVLAIGIQDRECESNKYLLYNNLKSLVRVYRAEGYKSFFSFVRIKHDKQFKPWICAEFSDNKELVQKFVDIFPESKIKMRNYALQVSKYECHFTWSDAELAYSAEELEFTNDALSSMGETPLTTENVPQAQTSVYLDKTTEELQGDAEYVEKLRTLAGPAKLGGVIARAPELGTLSKIERTKRTIARLEAIHAYHRDGERND